jgi:hypothetical protein
MKRLIVLISFITISFASNAQDQSINYLKDFDFLYKTIVNNSVSFKIYCEEAGLDSVQIYHSLRKDLEQKNSMETFAVVAQKLFNVSADLHNGFVSKSFFENTYSNLSNKEQNALLNYVDTLNLKQGDQ